ncbi:MAG: TonB-dependent receptor [Proteobacteria bacterium]|nr:TonB-dependent receptor [Pseudomonadota bacterium]
MRFDRKTLLATTIIAGFTVLAPSIAAAQDQQPAPAPAASSNEVTEVVVTGSRIHRNEFNSAAPIQVITSDTATLEGLATTSEILQSSSLVAGAFQVNNQLTGFVVTGGPGSSTISLRGLGANRTLILVDGHRMGPAGVGGTVGPFDLNVVPSSIVDRIEILKDGASSIYGSDAVAGVINLITKKNIDGGIINASGRVTQHGGGDEYDVNAAWGKVFDRGFFNVSADYNDQMVLHRGDRPDTSCAADYVFDPTTFKRLDLPGLNGGFKCFNGAGFANVLRTSIGDLIYPDAGITYPTPSQGNSTGSGAPIPFGLERQARAGFPLTYPYAHEDNALYQRQSIISPNKLYTLNFRAGYDLTPDTELTFGLLLNRRDSQQLGSRQFFPVVNGANPNVPAGFAANFGLLEPIIPAKFDFDQTVNYANAYVGLKGKFSEFPVFGGWDWELYGRASRSDATYGYDFIYNDRVNAVIGSQACNQSAITISGGQCSSIPGGIPLLNKAELSGQFTPAEQAFLFGHEQGKTTYDEQEFEASMTGDLFSLPAGKVGAALGFDYRHNSIDDTPGFNNRNGNLWGSTSAGITKGSDAVKEVFAEVDVPLLKGMPIVKSLNLQASGRYTDYDSYGSNTTYKVGLDWQINSWLRLRGTKGTSFRAPALYELFLANQTGFQGQTAVDPCIQWDQSSNANLKANCQAAGVPAGYVAANSSSALIITGGGAGHLKAETSKADTLGLVFTPSFVDLSVAVDYTDLQVSNEVTTFGAGNIVNSCYTAANFPANPFCQLVTRAGFNGPGNTNGPGGTNVPEILTVNNSYVNVASQVERAIDLTVRYRHDFDIGRFQLDSQLTWDLHNTTQLFAGVPQPSYSGTTFGFKGPAFAGVTTLRFEHGPWTGLWTVQMIGPGSDVDLIGETGSSTRYSSTCRVGAVTGPCSSLIGTGTLTVIPVPVALKNRVEMTTYHTISLRRTFDTWVVQGGIQNLFDERPPSVSNTEFRAGTAALNGYDVLGRRFFLNISKKF